MYLPQVEHISNDDKKNVINKKGKINKINLKNVVLNINLTSKREIEFILKPDNGKIVRPYQVLKKIFNFTD